MKAGVMGADEFLITRPPLARNVLNLGTWFGFQGVVFRTPVKPAEISFRFRIPDQGYLVLTYNRVGTKFSGLRLSRRKAAPSMVFDSTDEGEFLSKNELSTDIRSQSWHRAMIGFSDTGILVEIEGKDVVRVPLAAPGLGQIGFRSGQNGAQIDDVVIKTAEGQVIRESFRNSKKLGVASAVNIGVLLAAGVGLAMWSSRRFRPDSKSVLLHCGLISLIGILLGGLWYAFDLYVWSKRPSNVLTHLVLPEAEDDTRSSFEFIRFRVFNTWWHRILAVESITPQGVSEQVSDEQVLGRASLLRSKP